MVKTFILAIVAFAASSTAVLSNYDSDNLNINPTESFISSSNDLLAKVVITTTTTTTNPDGTTETKTTKIEIDC